jgi:hypothetical protein
MMRNRRAPIYGKDMSFLPVPELFLRYMHRAMVIPSKTARRTASEAK